MVTSVPDVPKTDNVKYGEYLAGPLGHCMDCHTTYVMGVIDMNAARPRRQRLQQAVHLRLGGRLGQHHAASGRGPRQLDGRGDQDRDHDGVSRDGRKLLPFMPYGLYAKAQESDLDAIVAYLRSIPPLGAAPAAKD